MSHLSFRSGGGKRDAEKYFIRCGDPHTILRDPMAMDVSNERAIVHALIADHVVRKNARVVVKIGRGEGIRKDYQVGHMLRDIPGFLRAICLMACKDNVYRYKVQPTAEICSNDLKDEDAYVLVMPYIPLGPFRRYPWQERPLGEFKSCLQQVVLSLYYAFVTHGCLHTDIHLDNVLLKRTRKGTIVYPGHTVAVLGLEVVIMDFENAFVPVDRHLTHLFFMDLARVVEDITYTIRLRFHGQRELESYLQARRHHDTPIDIDEVLGMIGRITNLEKEVIQVLAYNPNVL